MKRGCGCTYEHPWRTYCPAAKIWLDGIAKAIKEKDWNRMRSQANSLILHEGGRFRATESTIPHRGPVL